MLTIIFILSNEEEYYSIICKDMEKFRNVEERLYDVYPQYKENENNFIVHGNKINKLKTLKENNIKHSDIIMMIPKDN